MSTAARPPTAPPPKTEKKASLLLFRLLILVGGLGDRLDTPLARALRVHLDDILDVDLLCAHLADTLALNLLGEDGEGGGEAARWAQAHVGDDDVPAGGDAVGDGVLGRRALELRLEQLCCRVEGRRRLGLLHVHLVARLSHHPLNLALEVVLQLLAVLGPHQRGGVLKSRPAQAGAVALDDARGQDGHDVRGKARDVAGDAAE
mmetsp:Transcript_18002/g.58896  ORF Transcript_18002/g.58896 Transcript_18002/m.58896 type:complete len:204 (-) Transcript_18002:3592-4203(-)